MKARLWLLMMLVGVLAGIAPSQAHHTDVADPMAQGKMLKIAMFIPGSGTDSFWTRVLDSSRAAAADMNVDLVVYNSLSVNELIANAKRVATLDFDAAIMTAPWDGSETAMEALDKGGLPTLLFNSKFSDPNLVPRVQFKNWLGGIYPNDFQAGKLLTNRLLLQAPNFNRLIVLLGSDTSSVSRQREAGMRAALEELAFKGKLEIVNTRWNEQTAKIELNKLLDQSREVSAVWAVTGELGLAARQVLSERIKNSQNIPVGGFNWGARDIEGLENGQLQVLVGGHYLDGAFAISMLVDYLHGLDFATQTKEFESLMVALDDNNLGRFRPLLKLSSQVNYQILSLAYNPQRFRFDFDVDTALQLITSRRRDRQLELPAALSAWAEQHPIIRFSADPSVAPFEYIEEGEYQGLMSSYLNEISLLTGLEFSLQHAGKSFFEIEQLLKNKQVDLIPLMVPSTERSQYMNFSDAVFSDPIVIFGSEQIGPVSGINYFRGKKVAAVKGYYSSRLLAQEYPSIILVETANSTDSFRLLANGEVDGVAESVTSGMYTINKAGFKGLSPLAPVGERVELTIAVRKDWPELVDIINAALAKIDEPTRKAIYDYWVRLQYQVGLSKEALYQWVGYPVAFLVAWLLVSYRSRSKLKRQLKANQRLNKRFKALYDSASDLIFLVGYNGDINDCNHAAAARLGYLTVKKLNGLSLLDVSPRTQPDGSDSMERLHEMLQQVVDNGEVVTSWNFRSSFGDQQISTDLMLKKVHVDDSPVILVTGHDITESLQLKQKIEAERNMLQELFDQSPVGLLLIADGYCQFVNPKIRALTGIETGQSVESVFVHQEQSEQFYDAMDSDDEQFSQNVIWRADNQQHLKVLLNCHRYVFHEHDAWLCWALDVTEYERIQDALADAQDDAHAAARAQARFLASMSHEIRTPLNAILGMAYLASQNSSDKSQLRYINNIHSSASSLLTIISDILDFSKIEAGRLQLDINQFDLFKLLKECSSEVAFSAERKDIELVIDAQVHSPRLWQGDPLRIKQVLLNLLSNAVKFTPNGGLVTIKLRCEMGESERYQLHFEVSDSGIGMSPEVVKRLFTPFSQGDAANSRRFGDTGLGLAITKKLVELMGGEIRVVSEQGQGSRFSFTIELQAVEPEPAFAQSTAYRQIQNQEVCLVGQQTAGLTILQEMLTVFGVRHHYRADLAALVERPPQRIDTIICMGLSEDEVMSSYHRLLELGHYNYVNWLFVVSQYEDAEGLASVARSTLLYRPVIPAELFDGLLANYYAPQPQFSGDNTTLSSRQEKGYLQQCQLLLVEDNQLNQELILGIFDPFGLDIDIANNGQECLNMLADKQYDLILMDCQMPVMDGYEATRRIRQQPAYEQLPIIALTADALQGDRERTLEVGMSDYIAKPIDIPNLFRVLDKWLKPKVEEQPLQSEQERIEPDVFEHLNSDYLDVVAGLLSCDNNQELYQRILNSFVSSYSDGDQSLEAMIEQGDIKSARRLMHSLKGIAASIGAMPLSRYAKKIERMLAEPDHLNAESLSEVVGQLSELLMITITEIKKTNWNHSDREMRNKEITPEQIQQKLHRLVQALNNYDTESVELFEEIAELNVFSDELTSSLYQKISTYEFADAAKLIANVRLGGEA